MQFKSTGRVHTKLSISDAVSIQQPTIKNKDENYPMQWSRK